MRTTTTIKTIGILCIVFGALGVLGGFLEAIMVPEMLDRAGGTQGLTASDLPEGYTAMAYGKIIVNGLYLAAGIFFLLRKSFSVRLMFISLALSLAFSLITGLFFRANTLPPTADPNSTFPNLTGPLIDVLLLVWVYRIRQSYFLPPEAETRTEEPAWLTPPYREKWTIAGILCLLVPLSIMGLWFYVSGMAIPREEKVTLFKSYFPGFLQGQWNTTYLSLLFAVMAIVGSGLGLGLKALWYKVVNGIVLALAILLLMMNLFALM